MLVQEPYVNGKNIIPKPSADIGVIVDTSIDLETRPRACIYHHRSLADKLWRMDIAAKLLKSFGRAVKLLKKQGKGGKKKGIQIGRHSK